MCGFGIDSEEDRHEIRKESMRTRIRDLGRRTIFPDTEETFGPLVIYGIDRGPRLRRKEGFSEKVSDVEGVDCV